jgi:hypothetical protein
MLHRVALVCNIPQDAIFHSQCCKNLKSYKCVCILCNFLAKKMGSDFPPPYMKITEVLFHNSLDTFHQSHSG